MEEGEKVLTMANFSASVTIIRGEVEEERIMGGGERAMEMTGSGVCIHSDI